jgi:hypothetical protein
MHWQISNFSGTRCTDFTFDTLEGRREPIAKILILKRVREQNPLKGVAMIKCCRLWMNVKIRAILLCLVLFSWPSIAVGGHWGLLGEDNVFAVYVDEGSITLISDTASKVWLKIVPKGRGFIEDVLKSRKEQGLDVKGYENFAYRMESVEVECALEKHRILETADYDGTDQKIGASFPISGWKQTQPNTPYDSVTKLICREHSEEDYWWGDYPDHESHEEE